MRQLRTDERTAGVLALESFRPRSLDVLGCRAAEDSEPLIYRAIDSCLKECAGWMDMLNNAASAYSLHRDSGTSLN